MALNRMIVESAIDVSFLAVKNEQCFYDDYVLAGLAPERDLYDTLKAKIANRGGAVLPIEQSMLTGVERLCRRSGLTVEQVESKKRNWAGGLRQRLDALNVADSYVFLQRVPSHMVHGTWADVLTHHLEVRKGGFAPDPSWLRVDPRLLTPVCIILARTATDYLSTFFGNEPELRPVYERVDDLRQRLHTFDLAHEEWFRSRPPGTDRTLGESWPAPAK